MSGTETVHRWPPRKLVGDYVRAGVGLAVTAPPLFFVAWTPSVVVVLGGLSLLFAWLGLRAAARQRASVVMNDAAIARNGRSLSWAALTAVRLRRFGGRKKGGGYMELQVRGPATRIGVDSDISDFLTIARRVFEAARANGVALDTRTVGNFQALGIRA